MKLLSLLFLTIILGKGCDNATAQDMQNTVIEYTANTRGFYQNITIKDQLVSVSKDRNNNDKAISTKISDADWAALINDFKELKLETLKDLKAPTEKRFYDGAAIANLKITYKDKSYETTSFDHGFPPKEIKKLVDKINTFAKKEQY
ncbi:hypothetical protein LNP27_04355 [Flavobacterium galactosidilyticum]|uniref:hypothetical protein n=1 Tax=Flavobacterium galactosidilyticum TaxID=2893886 RepID=UPI001E3656F2|nr:hypothetical protein [Flavobacterium sp. F-340]UFH47272.1 hypothetical protein LNP27_04355 [Flavobacterium sp. F-340]